MKRILNSLWLLSISLPIFAGTIPAASSADTNNITYGPPVVNSPEGTPIKPLSQENLFLFGATLQAVREFYVDPVTDDTIVDNAVSGMLTNLDPHSDYLNEQDFADLKAMTDGQFSGIGVEITADNGALLVISPIDDSPAQKAGIKAGDYIVKINGTAVEGLSLTKAIKMMRGPKGQKITLTIVRKGLGHPLDITVVRDNIKLTDVKTKIINNHYAYIRVSVFEEKTGAHLRNAVTKLLQENQGQIYGVILDLRNNPGGVVDAAVDVANVFLDINKVGYNKLVVYTKGRVPEAQFSGYVKGHDMFNGIPMVVLINSGSASASEIVAGALQDDHRSVIVGIQSFGKGSVQTVFPLPGGKTAIKLTTARYYTPAGRSIQAQGIAPDVKVNEYEIPDTVKAPDDNVIREADLASHLVGGNDDTTIGKTSSTPVNTNNNISTLQNLLNPGKGGPKPLMYDDYQLYQATNILEALHISTQSVGPTNNNTATAQ
jgi:carboxyl-terminal processing protease